MCHTYGIDFMFGNKIFIYKSRIFFVIIKKIMDEYNEIAAECLFFLIVLKL